MVFVAVRTHFPKKNTRVYRNKHSNLRNSRNIESSRSTSLEFAAFGNGSVIKHGRASASGIFCLQPWFLQRTEHISLRKTHVFMSIQLRSINNCFFKVLKLFLSWQISTSGVVVSNVPFHSGGFGGSSILPSRGADFFLFFLSLFFNNYFKKWITSNN